METNKIDSIFKKSIVESEDYYETEANSAKSRIWSQVQHGNNKKTLPLLFRLLVAACILLFISTSFLFVSNIGTRNKLEALTELNTDMKNKVALVAKNDLINKELLIAANLNSPDTVFIEKKVIVTKSIIQKERITDTVYIQQIVYVENELIAESIIDIENSIPTDSTYQIITDNYSTEILINNTKTSKKENKKKFRLKFGGNRNSGNERAIALSSKL